MSAYPTQAQFAGQIGTAFAAGETGVELVLDAVRSGIESAEYAPFSLEFLCEGQSPLPQATYALAHGLLGTHELFLVPIAHEKTATRYEAVFNVVRESEG